MSTGDLSSFFAGGFDVGSVAPMEDYAVLPPGDYPVLIEKAEIKATKAGNGHYIELAMSVIDGPGKNRKLWDRLNFDNPNPAAVEIANKTLAALARSIGLTKVSDTTQLVNNTCIACVKVKDGQNGIRTYTPIQATAPAVGPPPPPMPSGPAMQPAPAVVPASMAVPVDPQGACQPPPAPAQPPAAPVAPQPPAMQPGYAAPSQAPGVPQAAPQPAPAPPWAR